MKAFIQKLIDKYWTRENRSYIFWGLLTTIVSIVIYYAIIYFIPATPAEIANAIAIACAIIFAYVVNKRYVFHSRCPDFKSLLREFWAFVSVRIISAILEEVLLSFFIRIVHANEYLAKIIVCFIIFIVNYVMSKMFVFKHKEQVSE
ncbi:MAG: GtrA family protein [Lachnospiraceae bacterium]|nr:GtrA family protein [Lachnospiraceae bacterium]